MRHHNYFRDHTFSGSNGGESIRQPGDRHRGGELPAGRP